MAQCGRPTNSGSTATRFGEPVIRAYIVGREDVYSAREGAVKVLGGVLFED